VSDSPDNMVGPNPLAGGGGEQRPAQAGRENGRLVFDFPWALGLNPESFPIGLAVTRLIMA